jgi:hydrogenase/urease accessory protein HupE
MLASAGVVLNAHDPGLSSLDITVAGNRVSAMLSLSAPDVVLVAPDSGARAPLEIGDLAKKAIRLSVDGEALFPAIDRAWVEDGAAYVKLVFPAARLSNARLTVGSDVPARVAYGHRQLLTISEGDRVIARKLFDAQSGHISVALGSTAAMASDAPLNLFALGVRHILTGFDHLVFLAGLLFASRNVRELVTALTAFTIAHSITLAMAAGGAIHAPASIVEPLIAASIAWVGLENLIRVRPSGVRWMVVFAFGLVHGFGFAEALLDVGRWSSPTDIVVTLVTFNAGVEAGQIAVAAVLLPLLWLVRARPAWNARLSPACSATIAIAGGYWLLERL